MNKVNYICKHRKAFRKCYRKHVGHVSVLGWFHDMDKIVLLKLGLSSKLVSKLHRKYSLHHQNMNFVDKVGSIIDWECARFTKPDKPLNAKETLNKFYSQYKTKLQPTINKLKLNKETKSVTQS